MRTWIVVVLLVALAGLAGNARAGRIEGTVRFSESTRADAAPTLSPYAGRLGGEAQADTPPPAATVEEIALWLDTPVASSDAVADTGSGPPPAMRQVNVRFDPRVLVIPIGTTVNFPNEDPLFHNVFSYSPTKRFDLGRYGKNDSAAVLFDRPGLVQVFCDVHASMSAHILVVDSAFVTQPGADGRFAIDGVPAGRHRLALWHPDHGEREIEITVTDDEATSVEIEF